MHIFPKYKGTEEIKKNNVEKFPTIYFFQPVFTYYVDLYLKVLF